MVDEVVIFLTRRTRWWLYFCSCFSTDSRWDLELLIEQASMIKEVPTFHDATHLTHISTYSLPVSFRYLHIVGNTTNLVLDTRDEIHKPLPHTTDHYWLGTFLRWTHFAQRPNQNIIGCLPSLIWWSVLQTTSTVHRLRPPRVTRVIKVRVFSRVSRLYPSKVYIRGTLLASG